MKKLPAKKSKRSTDKLRAEYRFDYRNAQPNRFAAQHKAGCRVVVLDVLDPDIAQVFTTSKSVNAVLRALLATMPRQATDEASPG